MHTLAMKLMLAVFGAVVTAVPTCEDFAANLPDAALKALNDACAASAKAWFCENCTGV